MKKELYIKFRQQLFALFRGLDFLLPKKNYILCYHSFSRIGNSYSVTPENFKKHILLLQKKYNFVGLDELFTTSKKNCIALTVDDGYEDIFSIMPIVEKYRIPLTLFALGNPQQANRNELNHPGKLLTFGQLKELQKKGVVIGSHSMTHANLGELKAKQLKEEIIQSKKILEQKLNVKVKYFAFPKGIYTEEALRLVKLAGYKAAFTVQSGMINGYSLLTPRTIIDQYYLAADIPLLLNPLVITVKSWMNRLHFWRLMPSI